MNETLRRNNINPRTGKPFLKMRYSVKNTRDVNHKVKKDSPIVKTAKEYSSTSVIHGLAYTMSDKQSLLERLLWTILVCSAFLLSSYQLQVMYKDWQDKPVITVLDTVSLPIEEIEFPAITICPQGSSKDIMDAALFKQFKDFVLKKTANYTGNGERGKRENRLEISSMTIAEWINLFYEEVWQGIQVKPTELLPLMTSNDPDNIVQGKTIWNSDKEELCDDSSSQAAVDLIRQEMNPSCPNGFEMLDNKFCIHLGDYVATYGEAEFYCESKTLGGGNLLSLENQEQVENLRNIIQKGELPYYKCYFGGNKGSRYITILS